MFSLFDPIYTNTKEFPVKLRTRRIDIVTYCVYTWNTFNSFQTFHNKIKHNARSYIWYLLQRICLFNEVGKSQFCKCNFSYEKYTSSLVLQVK